MFLKVVGINLKGYVKPRKENSMIENTSRFRETRVPSLQ